MSKPYVESILPTAAHDYLQGEIRAGHNIFISGRTGAGKTSLLREIGQMIKKPKNIATVENSFELGLANRHVFVCSDPETREHTPAGRLLEQALTRNPSWLLLDEIRDLTTADTYLRLMSGHRRSIATIHANTAEDALERLSMLAWQPEDPIIKLHPRVTDAVDTVVHVIRSADTFTVAIRGFVMPPEMTGQANYATGGNVSAKLIPIMTATKTVPHYHR